MTPGEPGGHCRPCASHWSYAIGVAAQRLTSAMYTGYPIID